MCFNCDGASAYRPFEVLNNAQTFFAHQTSAKAFNESSNPFDVLRATLDGFTLATDLAVHIGSRRGGTVPLFEYVKGDFSHDLQVPTASASKVVSALVVMRVVETGRLRYDTLASELLPYWTRDPADSRSRISLRHALSYTTGFTGVNVPLCFTLQDCTRASYTALNHTYAAGSVYDYSGGTSLDLGLAATMAEVATGRAFNDLANDMFVSLGMSRTRYELLFNPSYTVSSGLTSTARDYNRLMSAFIRGELVSAATRSEMERNQFPLAQRDFIGLLIGHYGFGLFYECLLSGIASNGMTPACAARREFSCVGLFGFFPGWDSIRDYHYQFAMVKDPVTAFLMRLAFKPMMDFIIDSIEGVRPAVYTPINFTADDVTRILRLAQKIHHSDNLGSLLEQHARASGIAVDLGV